MQVRGTSPNFVSTKTSSILSISKPSSDLECFAKSMSPVPPIIPIRSIFRPYHSQNYSCKRAIKSAFLPETGLPAALSNSFNSATVIDS